MSRLRFDRLLATILCLAVGITASGCGLFGTRVENPPPIRITIRTTTDANSCNGLAGNPIQVRIYRSSGSLELVSSSLSEFWYESQASESLKTKLLQEERLSPSDESVIVASDLRDSEVITVVAGFCEPALSTWFTEFKASEARKRNGAIILLRAHDLARL